MLYRRIILALLLAAIGCNSQAADDTAVMANNRSELAVTGVSQSTVEKDSAVVANDQPAQSAQNQPATPPSSLLLAPGSGSKPVAGAGSGVFTADPYAVVLGLLFIIVLIFLLAWLLRRMGAVSMVGGQAMRVMAALSVGPREKVILLDIAGKQLLLGVAPGRVSHLRTFDEALITAPASAAGDFSAKLKQLLNTDQKHTGDSKTV